MCLCVCVRVCVCMFVCVCAQRTGQSDRFKTVKAIQTSNLTRMFPETVRTWLLKHFFRKGGVCKNSLGGDMHSHERRAPSSSFIHSFIHSFAQTLQQQHIGSQTPLLSDFSAFTLSVWQEDVNVSCSNSQWFSLWYAVEVEQSLTPHPTQYRSFRRRIRSLTCRNNSEQQPGQTETENSSSSSSSSSESNAVRNARIYARLPDIPCTSNA